MKRQFSTILILALLCAVFLGSSQGAAQAGFEIKQGGEPVSGDCDDQLDPADTASDGNFLCSGALSSLGRAPSVAEPMIELASSPLPPLTIMSVSETYLYPAYAMDLGGEDMIHIPDTTDPGTWDLVTNVNNTEYHAGDFVGGDFTHLYVLDMTSNELHRIHTTIGFDKTIGPSTPISGTTWTGATGTISGTLYASSANVSISYLYTVDMDTGTATEVGEITNAPAIIDIAINTDGEMYGVDIVNDVLVQIDPATGAGTVIGSIGFDARFAQGMDFEETTGVLYLAAFNSTDNQGELRIADTATGNSVLVGAFPSGAETDALAFAEPEPAPVQLLQNRSFESGLDYWTTEGYPTLSTTSYSGTYSLHFSGEEAWAWQEVFIPIGATDVTISYVITGISADTEFDNDIFCGGLWDLTRQTRYVRACYGLAYFYHYPMVWKYKSYHLNADELASVSGKKVLMGLQLEQDWLPGYSKTSFAYVDLVGLIVTAPILDQYALSVSLATGGGSVSSAPDGIDCGTDCTETYDDGTAITLTATADTGYTFTGWTGACTNASGDCVVTMDAAKSVTATFTRGHALTVSLAGTGGGSVTSSPAGIDCSAAVGSDCSEIYAYGTDVTLTATAASGSTFTGWSGICSPSDTIATDPAASDPTASDPTGVLAGGPDTSSAGDCILTMTETQTATATFGELAIFLPLLSR